jgi:hypothetical protein
MLTGKSSEKQRNWLLELLKKNKNHPDLPKWWEGLKQYWVVTELAPGVTEGSFSEDLPSQVASEYIDTIKTATAGAVAPKFDAEMWAKREGTYWVDPATSNIVWVRFAQKSQKPYGKVAVPGSSGFVYEHGLLRHSLVPLTVDEFNRVLAKYPGRCPLCRREIGADGEGHADLHKALLSP